MSEPRTDAGRDLMYFLNTETGGGDYSQSIIAIEAEASRRQEALEKALRELVDAAEDYTAYEGGITVKLQAALDRASALLDAPQPVEP